MEVFLISLAVFLLAALGLGLGVLFRRPPLRAGCGPRCDGIVPADGCPVCGAPASNRKELTS